MKKILGGKQFFFLPKTQNDPTQNATDDRTTDFATTVISLYFIFASGTDGGGWRGVAVAVVVGGGRVHAK